ncbi:MAG: ATP synthase F1 subunit delta [Candidatus Omnitrophica bacterium]|nr:ATP synthase F1 subunit delta [Candidatus Omnitrophota bacterium]
MIPYHVVHRYNRALFQLAEERKETDKIEKDFSHFIKLLAANPTVMHLMLNSIVSQSEKTTFLDKTLSGNITPTFLHFLKVLVRKQRFSHISDIQKEYHRLYEKKQGVQEVSVISAVSIKKILEEKIYSVLKKITRSEVRLIKKVDPSMIGGLVIRFNGTEIDASYRDQFRILRQRLMAS